MIPKPNCGCARRAANVLRNPPEAMGLRAKLESRYEARKQCGKQKAIEEASCDPCLWLCFCLCPCPSLPLVPSLSLPRSLSLSSSQSLPLPLSMSLSLSPCSVQMAQRLGAPELGSCDLRIPAPRPRSLTVWPRFRATGSGTPSVTDWSWTVVWSQERGREAKASGGRPGERRRSFKILRHPRVAIYLSVCLRLRLHFRLYLRAPVRLCLLARSLLSLSLSLSPRCPAPSSQRLSSPSPSSPSFPPIPPRSPFALTHPSACQRFGAEGHSQHARVPRRDVGAHP